MCGLVFIYILNLTYTSKKCVVDLILSRYLCKAEATNVMTPSIDSQINESVRELNFSFQKESGQSNSLSGISSICHLLV